MYDSRWLLEMKAYRQFRKTDMKNLYDVQFVLNRLLNRCFDDGLTADTPQGVEAITNVVREKMWNDYQKREGLEFVDEANFWKFIQTHQGGRGKVSAAILGCLEQEGHLQWAHAAGLCDGRDSQGRSVLHAACLPQNERVSEKALLRHVKWKSEHGWQKESKDAMISFIAFLQRARYDAQEICLEMASWIERHQAADLAKEYTQTSGKKTYLRTFASALWLGASRQQSEVKRAKWLERLHQWEVNHGWTEKETWHLTVGFEKLPPRVQAVLAESKANVERLTLNKKHADLPKTIVLEWAL